MSTYQKIDPEFKANWLKALRSGRYRQTQSTLRNKVAGTYGYCCIGVACNIINPRKWKQDFHENYGWMGNGHDWDADIDFIGDNHAVAELIGMNDGGKTFKEIADWIEENL